MRRIVFLLGLLAATAAFALPVAAQSLYSLDPGDPVRVTSDGRTFTGELVALSADSLRLSERVRRGAVVGRLEHSVALSDVEVAYVRRPRTREKGALRGAIIGGIVPGTALVAYGASWVARGRPTSDDGDLRPVFLGAATVAGAAVGAGIGALTPGGWWEATDRVRVEAASSGLGVRVRF